jgi:mycothiol synthase
MGTPGRVIANCRIPIAECGPPAARAANAGGPIRQSAIVIRQSRNFWRGESLERFRLLCRTTVVFSAAMSVVSNFFRGHDPLRREPAGPVTCRPARKEETHAALRLILGRNGRLANDSDVLDFLRLAVHRRINVNLIWIAERHGRPVWAVLPIVSPGKTVLLLCPGGPRETAAPEQLLLAVLQHHRMQGVELAQVLVEPDDPTLLPRLARLDFAPMAQLTYLQRSVPRALGQFELPPPLRSISYSADTHQAFASTILQTYEHSLDCPALNGKRQIEDILRGHRATGEFDPTLWSLILENDTPIGVSLLARLAYADACELVYFGLVPQARGRGLGHVLLQHALAQLARTDLSRLNLAVDSANAPALHLYSRHGLTPVGRKIAMMRPLHPPAPAAPDVLTSAGDARPAQPR